MDTHTLEHYKNCVSACDIITFYVIILVMETRSVFVTVGNICDEFSNDLKYLSNGIILRYHIKKRIYGCKVTICAKNRVTDKTILYTLIKIRSVGEIDILRSLFGGISEFLHQYYNKPSSDNSD